MKIALLIAAYLACGTAMVAGIFLFYGVRAVRASRRWWRENLECSIDQNFDGAGVAILVITWPMVLAVLLLCGIFLLLRWMAEAFALRVVEWLADREGGEK